jgi:acyl-coenzyme A synthetase/AMP-(fatty) acid ligase
MTSTLRSFRSLALVAAFLGSAACQVSTDKAAPRIAAIQAGNNQTMPAGSEFNPLGVVVLDQYDFAAQNVQVTWTILSGGGTLTATNTKTNENGVASTIYTAGTTGGPVKIVADISGVGQLTFNECVTDATVTSCP